MRAPRSSFAIKVASGLACLVVLAAGTGTAQPVPPGVEPPCPTGPSVEVSGSGEVTVQPDHAVVTVGVRTEADTAQAALETNSHAMAQAIAEVEKAGVPAARIRTETVQLHARYGQPQPGQRYGEPAIVGYTAVNTARVQVDDLARLGQLLDAVVSAGANTIQSIEFEVGDQAAVVDRARAAAWEDAQHKAEQLAKLAGARLGEVLSITESSRPPHPILGAAVMAKEAVPIEPGTQIISAEVHVVWRLLTR